MREDANGLACYRLHETMREYAALKLGDAGERDMVDLRCTEYYLSRNRQAVSQGRYRLVEWLEWMDLEIDNVRSVLQRCLHNRDYEHGIDLASSVGWYWVTRATTEGVRWLDELLVRGIANPDSRAPAYFIRGFLAVLQSDPTMARPTLERAVAAAREAGQLITLSHSLSMSSIAENIAGDHAAAGRFLEEAQTVTARLDDLPARLTFLQARALNGLFEGNLDAVRAASSEGARLSRATGDLYVLEMMLINLGMVALMAGDLEASKPLFAEALRIAARLDDRGPQYYVLDAMGCIAASSGQARLAAQLLGAAEGVRAGIGGRVVAMLAPLRGRAKESAIAALGASRFEYEFKAGKGLNRDAALRLALGESAHVASPSPDSTGPALLGKREADVAKLVADGLSNKQIGARLFISEHTVDSHVRNILNKLGFNSRAQIAAWMASSQR